MDEMGLKRKFFQAAKLIRFNLVSQDQDAGTLSISPGRNVEPCCLEIVTFSNLYEIKNGELRNFSCYVQGGLEGCFLLYYIIK